jgi:dipeptidyl aminopeptidase/acylaminoacyl peptidase
VGDCDGKNAGLIDTGQGEIGRPDWVPGLVAARWAQDGSSILAVRRHQGRDTLLSISWPKRSVSEIKTAWTEMEWLQAHGSGVVLVGSNPATPPTLCTLELNGLSPIARAAGSVGIVDSAALAEAEVISWKTPGELPVWGIFYRAGASGRQNRPLIVFVHGGPTSEKALGWDAQAQYFATRGWHYLAVNYRGSTGYGREYQELLRGQWGVVDVQDACDGASHLVQLGLADSQRLVIAGASAGGYTTLMALTQNPDFWAAGISLFGIGNLYDLKQGSHRFEVNYEEFLIGKLPEKGPLWKERSPLRQAQKVRAPVLLFHGAEDKAVPLQQSVDFAGAVRRAGGIAELATYDGEGHGFQKEATRRDVIEKMERFLDKYVLCLQK